jgi:hypothetical protein
MSLIEFVILVVIVAAATRMACKAGAAAGVPALAIGIVLSLATESQIRDGATLIRRPALPGFSSARTTGASPTQSPVLNLGWRSLAPNALTAVCLDWLK